LNPLQGLRILESLNVFGMRAFGINLLSLGCCRSGRGSALEL
jgi:hypothetical protein